MIAALEFRGISHQFGHRFGRGLGPGSDMREVLRAFDLVITPGERHALIGPNGAGKSTLFNIACGALRPSAGRVILDGADITGLAPFEISRRGLARSQQVTSLFPHLSVRDNLRCAVLGARPDRYAFWRALEGMADVRARAEAMAEAVGLAAQLDRSAGELPYAAQRGLEIGVALAGDAKVILLDEPTAGMSQDESRAMVALIRRLTEGRTLLLVEHDMDVVFGLADRVSVLAGGALIATGTPEDIRRNPQVREVYPTAENADA